MIPDTNAAQTFDRGKKEQKDWQGKRSHDEACFDEAIGKRDGCALPSFHSITMQVFFTVGLETRAKRERGAIRLSSTAPAFILLC